MIDDAALAAIHAADCGCDEAIDVWRSEYADGLAAALPHIERALREQIADALTETARIGAHHLAAEHWVSGMNYAAGLVRGDA